MNPLTGTGKIDLRTKESRQENISPESLKNCKGMIKKIYNFCCRILTIILKDFIGLLVIFVKEKSKLFNTPLKQY